MVPCNFTAVAEPTKVVLFIPSGSSVLVVRGRLATTLLPPVVAVVNCDTCSTSASVRPSTSAHLSNVIIRSICYIHTPDIKMLTDWTCCGFTYIHTHTRSTALCPGLPERASTRKVNQSGFYWSKRQWLAVVSPGLMQVLHIAPDRKPCQHPTTQFFTGLDALPAAQPIASKHWRQMLLHSTRHKKSIWRPSPSQSLGLIWIKLNQTKQKHAFTNQKKCTTTKNKH